MLGLLSFGPRFASTAYVSPVPRTLTPHGVRGSVEHPRSPGGGAPDARPDTPLPAGTVPVPRRAPSRTRAVPRPAPDPTRDPASTRSGAHRPVDSAGSRGGSGRDPDGDAVHTGSHRIPEPRRSPTDVPPRPDTGPQRRAPRRDAPVAGPSGAGPDRGHRTLARLGLHLALAAVPLLAISAQVFGLLEMRLALAVVIVPAVIVVVGLALFAPHPSDRVVTAGLVWGVVACVLYDLFRLDTVYVLGWWGDFIPTMGSWITGGEPGGWDGAVAGYLWRYLGDGGGIGVTFFVLATAVGLGRRSRREVVAAAVAFAVFPVWAGLIGTVAIAPRGEEMLFALTPVTVLLSLIGHLIFGVVLGLGFWRSRHVQSSWPWPAPGLRALPVVSLLPFWSFRTDPEVGHRSPARRGAARHSRPGVSAGQPPSRRSMPSSR